jgi:hypothetical protein
MIARKSFAAQIFALAAARLKLCRAIGLLMLFAGRRDKIRRGLSPTGREK